jgi:hypothetical protein
MTAVEWLTDQLGIDGGTMRDKALEMEKQQIMDAWNEGIDEDSELSFREWYLIYREQLKQRR